MAATYTVPETNSRTSRAYPDVVVQDVPMGERVRSDALAQATPPKPENVSDSMPVEPKMAAVETASEVGESAESDAAKPESPKVGTTKAEAPKAETTKPATRKAEAPKVRTPKQGAPKAKMPKPEVVATPKAQTEQRKPALTSNNGLITLHADNLDIRKALEMISRQGQMNILVAPGVTGTVTLDLRDKTMDDALQAIARLCQLSVRRERDFLYVATLTEVRETEENDLPVRVYRLNYVRSTDVEKMVKPLLSKKGVFTSSPEAEVGLPSDATGAARAGASESTKEVKGGGNSLAGGDIAIVQDYEDVLKKVDRVIAELDVQPIQVLIEAVIVSVKLDKNTELGVNFAMLDGAGKALAVAGSGAAINAATGFPPASVLQGTSAGTPNTKTTTTTITDGTVTSTTAIKTGTTGAVSNGFGTTTNGIKFGWVGGSTTGFVKALEGYGETKVLASPRILVLNKQRAEIHLGDQLGYTTSTQTQTSTTQTVNFMPVGTQLRLRPFVSSDGMVRMEIHPERSSGALDAAGVPQTNAQQVTTNVMVPDGATIVIGGLIDTQDNHSYEGIPVLCRLPWVGYLFRDDSTTTAKRELIVILTPHVWRPDCPTGLNQLGRPRTLGLAERVAQSPAAERRDGADLYELTEPGSCKKACCPSPAKAPVDAQREVPANSQKPVGSSQFR